MDRLAIRVSQTHRPRPACALLAIVLVLAGVAAGPVALADDPAAKAAAKAKLEKGARLMDGGDYAQALTEFEDAYNLVRNPKIQFNIGLANVGLARYPDAIRAFEQFMAEAKNASSSVLADAQKQIEVLRPKVAAVEVAADEPGIEIIIDGRSQGKTPITVRVYVDPGQHRLLAQRSEGSAPVVKVFKVAGGERQTLHVALPGLATVGAAALVAGGAVETAGPALISAAGSHPDVGEERPVYKKGWFWALVGGGAVAAAVGVFLLAGRSSTYPNASLGTVAGE